MSDASGLMVTARSLATDVAAAQVIAALQSERIDTILLKGPTIADWLYAPDVRGYVDADVLVSPGDADHASMVLERLGFIPVTDARTPHACPWIRPSDQMQVDLHVSIWGPHVPADRLWRELQDWVEVSQIGRVSVRTLTLPARALHVVLHAGQHRENSLKAREDLRRALEQTPHGVWLEAERLADRLCALGEMADGLMLDPAGQELLEHLPLARAATLVNHFGAPLAIGFARINLANGPRAKVAAALRGLAPPADEFVTGGPNARQVLRGYARRSLWLVSQVLPTLRALARAKRAGSAPGSGQRTRDVS